MRVCVVTGTRADYGLLYWTIRGLNEATDFELQLVVTGMHLSPEHGMTVEAIVRDGFPISERVEILLASDSSTGTAKAMGLGMIGFSEAFDRLSPDVVLLVGDRFEAFAAAATATVKSIPIAHCAGGEITKGVIDGLIRHSITKMAHLHFVATDDSRRRVIQMGEDPATVFVVGALGIENINRLSLMPKSEVEKTIGRRFLQQNLLITYHPETLSPAAPAESFGSLLDALDQLEDTLLIFTRPNADAGGRTISRMIDSFIEGRSDRAIAITSMGQLLYLSAMKWVDGVVGNSSSGIVEAPSLHTGSINVGGRQGGRVIPASVIDCDDDATSISVALQELFSEEFRRNLRSVENPYDFGNSSSHILRVMAGSTPTSAIKHFHDIPSAKG